MARLYSSPLQGYTDFRFRSASQKYFGGIDQYFAPYIRLNGKGEIKPANERDINPANNLSIKLVPQLMTKDAREFLFIAKYVQKLGYSELNWNLGCPYPMVTKRGMGSGMLASPEKIDEILSRVNAESDIRVSVKMRLGLESPDEIFKVLPVLDKYLLENITIHPRLGKQLYKGEVDLDTFERCIGQSRHKILYNGDITSVQAFRELKDRFPDIEHWMIGRGLIADPFLPAMIKADNHNYPENWVEIFSKFHDTLFSSYIEALSGPKHILLKMYHLWEYFIYLFPNPPKSLKKIKKVQNIEAYRGLMKQIIHK